jgi:hypothetical protein
MGFSAELVGGPADGEIRSLAEDLRALRLISPIFKKPVFESGDSGPTSESTLETIEVTYLRTKRFSAAGHRIYQYMK